MENKINDKRLLLGIVFLVVGGFILAGNLHFISPELHWKFREYFWHWPMILIAIGLIQVAAKDHKGPGYIFLLIGGVFMLPHFFHLPFSLREIFWPAIFILIGVSILFRSSKEKHHRGCQTSISDDQDIIDDMTFFGGGDKIVTSQNFKGGKVTCVFGGLNLNMLRTKLAPGKNIVDVFTVFGGMKMIVPEDWDIKIQVTSVFGGFSDKRRIAPTALDNKQGELIIRGIAIFGGGEIKNF